MEDIMAHTEGKDALLLLQKDHRVVEDLFERVETNPALFEEIRNELTIHATLEEEIVYPAIRAALPADERERIDEAVADHAEVKQILSELAAGAAGDQEFKERLEELRDGVLQHVEEEEDEMFAMARRVLDGATLAEMGTRMEARKAELKGEVVGA